MMKVTGRSLSGIYFLLVNIFHFEGKYGKNNLCDYNKNKNFYLVKL